MTPTAYQSSEYLRSDPLWPSNIMRRAFSGDESVGVLFGDLKKLFDAVEPVVPTSINNKYPVYQSLNFSINPNSETYLQTLYNEGVKLVELLGKNAVRAKIPDISEEAIQQGISHFGSLEKFAGYLHIRDFLHIAQDATKLELARDLGLGSVAQQGEQAKQLLERLDSGGHHGIHRLLEAYPEMVQPYSKDISPIVALYLKGRETFEIPSIANQTRAAYINGELVHAKMLGTELGAQHMVQAHFHAAGKDYAAFIDQKHALLNDIRKASLPYGAYFDNAKEILGKLVEDSASFVREENLEALAATRRQFLCRYGAALLDPQYMAALHTTGGLSNHELMAINSAVNAGYTKPLLPYLADAADAIKNAGHSAPTEGAAQKLEDVAAHAQKKTPANSAVGDSTSKGTSHLENVSASEIPTGNLGKETGKLEEGVESAVRASKFMGSRLIGTGLFGALAIDGLWHIFSPASKDQKSSSEGNKISLARVAEVSVGAIGVAASWMVKDAHLQSVFSKFRVR